ncbi:MAG: putative Rossmann fold nucleotide-binding protein [Gammaproteobacteria bacterium]|nr:putative Rossmann fold nucleotide-binding protein [Gammaproteobacteria bacterium]
MSFSVHTQAILLLTAHFSKPVNDAPKPLTTKEWARFAQWLKDHDINPEKLMNGHLTTALDGWTDKFITAERIEKLMNRGSALALAVEKWTRAGLWVVTRSDNNYPARLKQLLKTDCPAVLFGCGNPALLSNGGVAIVGARNAGNGDLEFSSNLGKTAAVQGYTVVSGGARGVDEAAMLGALENEGTVIGVLADSLLKTATSGKYRKYLQNQNLVLVSPYYPEAGFNAGNAMSRNKYIYCLSEAAVVVQSGTEGGTWNGAIENLKNQWVPLWVKEKKDPKSGNSLLVQKGAFSLADDISRLDINNLMKERELINKTSTMDLFKKSAVREEPAGKYGGNTFDEMDF